MEQPARKISPSVENISLDDIVLVDKCRRGDTTAMQRLIVKYQDRIYNTIVKICQNSDDAAELTQDTFVKFIEKISSFKGQSSFYTWLFRIAVNLTLNYCKRGSRIRMQPLEGRSPEQQEQARGDLKRVLADPVAPDPAAVAQNKELIALLYQCLGQLSDEQRIMIVLRDIESMSYEDIAQTLEIELGTVKSRLSRARAALKTIMEKVLE